MLAPTTPGENPWDVADGGLVPAPSTDAGIQATCGLPAQEPASLMRKGAGDHVNISPERDTLPWGTAGGLRPGSTTSWRNAPQSAMTVEVMVGALLVCLGLLLGASWTVQALQPKLRGQARERRRLNEEWSAVRTARLQRGKCPRCGSPMFDQDWCVASTIVDPPEDSDENPLDSIQAQVLRAMRLGVEYDLQQVCSASRVSLTQASSALEELQDLHFVNANVDSKGTTRYKKLAASNAIGDAN